MAFSDRSTLLFISCIHLLSHFDFGNNTNDDDDRCGQDAYAKASHHPGERTKGTLSISLLRMFIVSAQRVSFIIIFDDVYCCSSP